MQYMVAKGKKKITIKAIQYLIIQYFLFCLIYFIIKLFLPLITSLSHILISV